MVLPFSKNRTREICKVCWHVNAIGFSVPGEVWRAAVPKELQSRVVCLSCFTRMADEKLIPWDKHIQFFPVSLATHLRCELQIPR